MIKAYVGIGSNLNHPMQQVITAIVELNKLPNVKVSCISSFYRSKPLGITEQPDFINAVVAINTSFDPICLLSELQRIEDNQGRVRSTVRWAARTLDLDILLYGNLILSTTRLTIPHPHLTNREFVIYPLAEIAPCLSLPTGTEIKMLKFACPPRGIMVESANNGSQLFCDSHRDLD